MMDELIIWIGTQLDEDEHRAELTIRDARAMYRAGWADQAKRHAGQAMWVMDDIDAKRRILALHSGVHECPAGPDLVGEIYTGYEAPCLTVKLLALTYASRRGYLEEWRPDADGGQDREQCATVPT